MSDYDELEYCDWCGRHWEAHWRGDECSQDLDGLVDSFDLDTFDDWAREPNT